MDELRTLPNRGKISPAVLARLARLQPTQKLRAIVVLNTREAIQGERRPSRNERQAIIDEIRSLASHALPKIDVILTRFDGRRLSEAPTALGTIAVESTPAGIAALSESEDVKAILQDQPVSRLV
jgi:hypothetical protein